MRYKEYKKVGLAWIDEIPSHWEIKNVNSLFNIRRGVVIPKSDLVESGKYPVYSSQTKNHGILGYLNHYDIDGYSITWTTDGANAGTIFFREGKYNCTNICGILESRNEISKYQYIYYSYVLKETCIHHKRKDTNGYKIMSNEMKRIEFPSAPKEEQEKIARFLDWKINEIDILIEIYIKKISRLNDLKDLITSNYIFNGINRNIKFKKVGLSYIDQIPENWELEKIKFNFEIVKSIAGKEGYNVLSITQQGITIKDISKNEGQMASDYSKYQFVEVGDFAMNHMDLLTGYIDISKYFGVTSPDYRVFRIKNKLKIYDKYYLLMFQYFYKSRIFYKLGQGASHMGRWRLPADNFLNMKIPVPSYKDQVKIVDSINSKSDILNYQIERLKSIVFILKNLKQSLISDAVTGRIDVRNVHIPNYEKVNDIEDDAILEENFEEEV